MFALLLWEGGCASVQCTVYSVRYCRVTDVLCISVTACGVDLSQCDTSSWYLGCLQSCDLGLEWLIGSSWVMAVECKVCGSIR